MRRLATHVTLTIALLLVASSTAAAAEAELSLEPATTEEITLAQGESQPVQFTLFVNLSDFSCFEPARIPVSLATLNEGGVNGTLENDTLWLDVPEGSYISAPYSAQLPVNATLIADGAGGNASFEVIATIDSPGEPCLAPGGFQASDNATVSAFVVGDDSGAGGGAAGGDNATADDGNVTADGNETADGNQTGADGNATTDDNLTAGNDDGLPPGGGPIGEFEGGESAETVEGDETPGFGLALAVVGLLGTAWALRRKASR